MITFFSPNLRLKRILPLLFLVLALAGCDGGQKWQNDWRSPLLRDHPLSGRIWVARDDRFISAQDLITRLGKKRHILIGEKHDNADHHRIQAWITARLVDGGKSPAMVLEMIRRNQQGLVDGHRKSGNEKTLGAVLDWERSGWPAWEYYAPVLGPAFQNGLPVLGANLAFPEMRDLSRKGLESLGPDTLKALALDRPLAPAIGRAMNREIIDVHCGVLPKKRAPAMARIQLVRDATFAQTMIGGARMEGMNGSILIAGGGHVRADRGVPLHLKRQGDGDFFSVTAIEVARDKMRVQDYAAFYGVSKLPFDAVWFTPRRDEKDPCAAFRARGSKK